MTLLWLVGLFAMFISPLQAQEREDIAVTQLLSSTLTSSRQPIVLPQKDAQIVVSIHDAMPGATSTGAQPSLSPIRICPFGESAGEQPRNRPN
jgi:hypothetical protein